ncbi:MAG: zinc-ribbon domain-containing protein [Methanobrevibacter sp.]|nr:zinc-ribbon domain-containing protein [Methanobrevibacter sp.]
MICKNCGFEIKDENIKFCPACGAPTSPESQVNDPNLVVTNGKNPILAAILSFFIVGLGQIYLGLTKKGIILFIAAVVSGILTLFIIGWILWLIVWGYAIYDAYNSANKMNMGVGVQDTIDFNDL